MLQLWLQYLGAERQQLGQPREKDLALHAHQPLPVESAHVLVATEHALLRAQDASAAAIRGLCARC